MLSLRELRRAARLLEGSLAGARVRRIVQPLEHTLAFSFEDSAARLHLLISCSPKFARICSVDTLPEPYPAPTSFYEYALAHLLGSSLSGVEGARENRQICMLLDGPDGRFALILSILGARSNIYLLDATRRIVHSMRPLDETRRELKVGEFWSDPEGSVRSEGLDRWEEAPDQSYLQAIGRSYRQMEQKFEAELLARRIESVLAREKAFLCRKAVNLREDLGGARYAESYRRMGELLKGVFHTIQPGSDWVTAVDHETGALVRIPLDPKLSPSENLVSYFARYQRESRGIPVIQQQLESVQSSLAVIETLEEQLRAAAGKDVPELKSLEDIASHAVVRRLISRRSRTQIPKSKQYKNRKREVPSRLLPKRYMTEDGLEIWVGRTDEGNDYLTTRLARGNDLFFHLEGYPGSHVILRTEGRADPPATSLLDACELAVHFSKLKNAGSADVHVAPVKEVKKPKGLKPGLVYVRRGKTIRLRRDSNRLRNILAARLDE